MPGEASGHCTRAGKSEGLYRGREREIANNNQHSGLFNVASNGFVSVKQSDLHSYTNMQQLQQFCL